ncbi:unnamed protein product, partial [Meganyctiphanes norvegica]
DDTECQICFNIFNSENRRPRALPCGHIYCHVCMTKEIRNGKKLCPTCRMRHNAKRVEDLPVCILVERLVENITKTLNVGANAQAPETNDEEDERRKTESIQQTCSTITDVNDTITALDKIVMEKGDMISKREVTVKQLEKSIEEAINAIEDERKEINKEKTTAEKAKEQVRQGKVRRKHIEDAQTNLQQSKTKKTIANRTNEIETVQTNIKKWIEDVSTEFSIQYKVSEELGNILKTLKSNKKVCAETTISGKIATATLSSKNNRIHLHTFKHVTSHEGATTIQYNKVLSHLPRPPTLLFLDLACKNVHHGRIYIRLQPELHTFIKHIYRIFTGEKGNSILGNT